MGHLVKIEVEVDTLEQLAEALAAHVNAVLLDNMPLDTLRPSGRPARGRAITEASGGITPQDTPPAMAATGVDLPLRRLAHPSAPPTWTCLEVDPGLIAAQPTSSTAPGDAALLLCACL